ncbi:MAG: deoxyribodipyrimidine photolyase [Gemmatirosa sp.]
MSTTFPGLVLPQERRSALNDVRADPTRAIVLYWQVMAHRTRSNFALEYAIAAARAWGRPLVVLEALRCGYPWASDRLHRFALDGMADNAAAYDAARVWHLPYVEPEAGAGRGLLEVLGARACLVVTDEFPEFFLPRMLAAAGRKLARVGTRLEAVDGNGLLPMRSAARAWTSAPHFRRMLQRELPNQLERVPAAAPLRAARTLAQPDAETAAWLQSLRARWPAPSPALLGGDDARAAERALAALPIDHGVPTVSFRGGQEKARRVLADFVEHKLDTYATRRNEAEDPSNSGLSPYLHWGFVSVHEVFAAIADREGWTPARLAPKATGKREGWWGMGANAESFLDELVTWRELSYNTAFWVERHETYASLPDWARATLDAHRHDARPELFTREQLEAGESYDALWNATQGQLRTDGRIHNYLRILWGKKFLEWTREPEEALAHMLHLNNRWALDGRDPNSTSGITWVLGRYDHAWQERPVIGKVRPMSSVATARKIRVDEYVARYGAALPGRTASVADAGSGRGESPAPRRERAVPRDRGPARGAATSGLDVLPEE